MCLLCSSLGPFDAPLCNLLSRCKYLLTSYRCPHYITSWQLNCNCNDSHLGFPLAQSSGRTPCSYKLIRLGLVSTSLFLPTNRTLFSPADSLLCYLTVPHTLRLHCSRVHLLGVVSNMSTTRQAVQRCCLRGSIVKERGLLKVLHTTTHSTAV